MEYIPLAISWILMCIILLKELAVEGQRLESLAVMALLILLMALTALFVQKEGEKEEERD